MGSIKKKRNLKQEQELIDEINELQQLLDRSYATETEILIKRKQDKLESLYHERVNGVMVRSHAAWMEKGEKCTAHFLRLNQIHFVKKNIMSLYRKDVLVTNPQEILQEEFEYFKDRYSNDAILEPPNGVTEQYFPLNNVSVLSTSQQLSREGEITEQELLEAINSFSSGKSPGIDGIPTEMYKIFFTEIKKTLLESFNFSFQQGILSNSQREGVISILLKQNPDGKYKDPKWLKNWRPLTLLCCDTRILSKCIALRIKNIIGDVINNIKVLLRGDLLETT